VHAQAIATVPPIHNPPRRSAERQHRRNSELSDRFLQKYDREIVEPAGKSVDEQPHRTYRPTPPGEQGDPERRVTLLGEATAHAADIVVETERLAD
jgi:hypothetical protein